MIPLELAQKVLAAALRTGGDLAEIYVEDRVSLALSLEDARLENAVRGVDRGAGVRVFFGNLVTYAYTDDLSEAALLRAAEAASAAGRGSGSARIVDLTERKSPLRFVVEKPFEHLSIAQKAALLSDADVAARGYHPAIKQVRAAYSELSRKVWIFNSDGVYVTDDRNFVELRSSVIAQRDGITQRASGNFGAQGGLELLDRRSLVEEIQSAAETAIKMLDARPAPAGEMTVVLPNGWGGVLFHEACGHQMEADFITKGQSAYAGKVGEQVAAPILSAVDDGTIAARRGSFRFDDEGTPSQRTQLIEKGVLREYMWDLQEARRMGGPARATDAARASATCPCRA
ncbi:MAG: TldD/PmbA family protein [Anaerolineae bacterium]|nr:TldD/PmbA family protein [Anaerolineae bacterium]